MIASLILASSLVAAPPFEWGAMLERTGSIAPAPQPGPAPSPDPDVTPGPFRSPAPVAIPPRVTVTVYKLADAAGQPWEGRDRDALIRWVAARNAALAPPAYRFAAPSCPTGNCPR